MYQQDESRAGTVAPPLKAELPARRSSGLHYGFVALGLIILTIFVALGLGRHGYTCILPTMQSSLELTNTQTGELQTWNMFGYMITVVFAGVLATRFGARIVISVALLI